MSVLHFSIPLAELTPRFSSTTQNHVEDFSQCQFVLISVLQFGLMLDIPVAPWLCQTSTFMDVIEGEHGRYDHFVNIDLMVIRLGTFYFLRRP